MGPTYETTIVDLERHELANLLPDCTAASVTKWFSKPGKVEFVSQDRAGFYAAGVRQGALQARQVANLTLPPELNPVCRRLWPNRKDLR